MIQLHILLDKNLDTIESPLGVVYKEEFATIEQYLKMNNKEWQDIDFKTVHYNSNKKIPYKCGNFTMHRGLPELEGYHVCFKFKEQIYGKRPNK